MICLTGTDTIVVGGLSVGEATKDVSDSSNIDVIQLTHELRRLFRNQILESDFVCLGFSSLAYTPHHTLWCIRKFPPEILRPVGEFRTHGKAAVAVERFRE